MSSYKRDVANLMQQVTDNGIEISLDAESGGLRRTRKQLAGVEFETDSPCRNIKVVMTAGGALQDVIITEDSLDQMGHEEMARRLTSTIQEADRIATDAIDAALRSQQYSQRIL